ncbi:MAG: hypothetical protein WBM13_08370 [Bacteroidia bacterium]
MMKNKYIRLVALSALAIFAQLTSVSAQNAPFLQFGGKPAQDTAVKAKMSLWEQITKTPWVIQMGPSVVDDDDAKLGEFEIGSSKNFFPVFTSAEKRIKGKFGVQLSVSSESLREHGYWATDLHAKYSFLTSSIEDNKFFDPYVLAGLGHAYRDFPHYGRNIGDEKDNSMNANLGAGANFWIFPNAALFVQGVGKFVLLQKEFKGSNHIQYTAGVAFKIARDKGAGKKPVDEAPVVPYKRSKEAEDAIEYLRNVLNK